MQEEKLLLPFLVSNTNLQWIETFAEYSNGAELTQELMV